MLKYYDRDGDEITQTEWFSKIQDYGYKIVRKTEIMGLEVSTVWLGIDSSLGGTVPVIFETMVFGADEDTVWDDFQARYCTEEEALKDHLKLVQEIRPVKVLCQGTWYGPE